MIYYIDNKNYKKALEMLSRMPDEEKKNKMMLRYASLFINNEAMATIESLFESFPNIMVEELIPALMGIDDNRNRICANNFVRQSAQNLNTKLIYNLYVFFLAQSRDDAFRDELDQFLEEQEALRSRGEPLKIDRDFVLNVFQFFGQTRALIRAYALLDMYEDAVKMALDQCEFDLAKNYANMPKSERLRKKLWQYVAAALLDPTPEMQAKLKAKELEKEPAKGPEKKGAEKQTSFALVTESQGNLVLNDVLHFVSPKIKLKTFRDDILSQVRMYDGKIDEFKADIAECNESAKSIADEYKQLHNAKLRIPPDKCCDHCDKVLINSGKFFTFPCLHGFHIVTSFSYERSHRAA